MEVNLQDGNVGNLGDILKHAALVQLTNVFSEHIRDTKYYLDSHSYLYQSRLAVADWYGQTEELLKHSALYQDYIDIEAPYINKGEYLCSSGLVNKLMPDAHLLLCESNRTTREWLLQQLADNRVTYHTVKEQMMKWIKGKSFKRLPNLLALIDPFELTDELWATMNQCLGKMLQQQATVIMLAFDYKKQDAREWPATAGEGLHYAGSIAMQPYHLAAYATDDILKPLCARLTGLAWAVSGDQAELL